jgi:AcrR family transcriptional regulator
MSDLVDGRVRRGAESREARRAQILERALDVFAERGYYRTSVTDLVKAAGVARGTFYLYFDGKEALFLELLEQLLSKFRGNIVGAETGPEAPPLAEQLANIVASILDTLQENRSLTRIIFREAVAVDEAVENRLRDFYGELFSYIAGTLRLGEAVSFTRPVDTDVVATCILGSLRGVVQRYVVDRDEPLDAAAMAGTIVDFNLNGIRM